MSAVPNFYLSTAEREYFRRSQKYDQASAVPNFYLSITEREYFRRIQKYDQAGAVPNFYLSIAECASTLKTASKVGKEIHLIRHAQIKLTHTHLTKDYIFSNYTPSRIFNINLTVTSHKAPRQPHPMPPECLCSLTLWQMQTAKCWQDHWQ